MSRINKELEQFHIQYCENAERLANNQEEIYDTVDHIFHLIDHFKRRMISEIYGKGHFILKIQNFFGNFQAVTIDNNTDYKLIYFNENEYKFNLNNLESYKYLKMVIKFILSKDEKYKSLFIDKLFWYIDFYPVILLFLEDEFFQKNLYSYKYIVKTYSIKRKLLFKKVTHEYFVHITKPIKFIHEDYTSKNDKFIIFERYTKTEKVFTILEIALMINTLTAKKIVENYPDIKINLDNTFFTDILIQKKLYLDKNFPNNLISQKDIELLESKYFY